MAIDFEYLARKLLDRIGDYLPVWIPGGRIIGSEYTCGDIRGGQGDSFKVNINTGMWADFATGEKGGDLISLYAAINNLTQIESAKKLNEQFEIPVPHASPNNLPPQNGIIPEMRHAKHGLPSNYWAYYNQKNQLVFYVARYDPPGEKKQFSPWSWGSDNWVQRTISGQRPLYGVELLSKSPDDTRILIVEGEKAAEALRTIAGSKYIVLTWSNGANSIHKTDWTPIYGRQVLIWPDNDPAGIKAANDIAKILHPHCSEVKILDVRELPESYDAADAVSDGWTHKKFFDWARSVVTVFNVQVDVEVTVNTGDEPQTSESMTALWERLGLAMAKGGGSAIPNEDNVVRIFEGTETLSGDLWFDDFYNSVFMGGRELKDLDIFKLTVHLQRHYGLAKISDTTIRRALYVIADRVHKNEPRDWLESLTWDNTPRIDEFFNSHLGAKNSAYVKSASRNFWLSLVARLYSPGCIMRTMVILKSKQWQGKSTAFALIGGKWYCEAVESIQSNNFLQSLHGKFLIEFADMSGMDRSDVNRIKQIISCRMDRFRAPYDRIPNDHPRQCVLVSTTNEGNFLKDDTGGSRFWPVETGKIDHGAITRDREQLFAEAVSRFKQNEDWYIMPQKETEDIQEHYRQTDEWEDAIHNYLRNGIHETSVGEIALNCLKIPIDKLDKSTQIRIGRNLATIGWKKNQKWVDNRNVKIWTREFPVPESESPGQEEIF